MKRGGLLALVVLSGCGGERGAEGTAAGKLRARGAMVAKVDGAAIGVDQVRELAEKGGLSPRVALERLEDEQLLAGEAARRGYGRPDLTEQAVKRALVQALLAETVEHLRMQDIPAAEVRARFDEVGRGKLAAESFAEHEAEVREQLLLERRKAALERLGRELRDRIGVRLDEAEVQKLLGDPAFWGEHS
jgi:hypothetical protein